MEQDNRINLYDTEDMTWMSKPIDSGRRSQSQSVANHFAKRIEAGEPLNGDRLSLKLQLAQKSGIARGTIWCTVVPKRCSDSLGLIRAQDSSQRFSMPHPCSVRLRIRLCRPRWSNPTSGLPAMVKYRSSRRKLVWNNRLVQAKQKMAAQLPSATMPNP